MRLSFKQLILLVIVMLAHTVSAQPGPDMGPGFGPGPGGERRPPELKFNYQEDKALFSSEEEANAYNNLLEEMKKKNPDLIKKLMDKLRSKIDPGQRPSPEMMKQRFQEMKQELKKLVEQTKAETTPEIVKDVAPAVNDKMTEVTPVEEPEVVPGVEAALELKKEKESEDQVVEDNRNYKPDTCVWVDDIPRKIVVGAGCSVEGSRICIGYVVCEQKNGGGKFTRMSTCSEGFCGDNDAVLCTKEKGFGSFKPAPEKAEFVSGMIKDLLQNKTSGQ